MTRRALYTVTAALIIYNYALWKFAARYGDTASDTTVFWFASLQVSADLVFLTLLLHFSGGVANPFLCYYVFHVVIASILLPPHVAFLQVGFAVTLLLGLTVGEASGLLRHYRLYLMWDFDPYRDPTYVAAVLFVTVTMLYFTALMATAITRRLRQREHEITDLSTAVQQHAEELEQAYGSLRQLEHEKSAYMYRAAHHLRAPLAAVENMLAVVSEGRAWAPFPSRRTTWSPAPAPVSTVCSISPAIFLALSRARAPWRPLLWNPWISPKWWPPPSPSSVSKRPPRT